MRVPAAIPSLALAAGSALGVVLPDGRLPHLACWILIAGAFAAALHALGSRRELALVGAVSLGCAASGVLLSSDAWTHAWRSTLRVAIETFAAVQPLPPLEGVLDDGVFVELSGVLREDAALRSGGVSLLVDVLKVRPLDWHVQVDPRPDQTIDVDGGALLSVAGVLAQQHVDDWRAGRHVRVAARLRRPTRYLNPGVPDHERQLARRGVSLVGSVKSGALVEVVSPGHWASETAARVRDAIRRGVARSVGAWSSRSAAIVTAVLIGDRAGLDDDVERRLQEAGTYHVIAISGGNIAILAGMMLVIFRVTGTLGATAMLTAAGGLAIYCLIVGTAGGDSVIRATLMAVVYLLGRAIDLGGSSANTLALTVGLILAADPLAIADPGFLLTVGATTAIVLAMARADARSWSGHTRAARALLLSSIAAEVALLPISAFVFSRVTVAGLLLNFIAIPLMAVVQVAGMAAAAVALVWPPLAAAAGWLPHQSAWLLVSSAELVEWLPILAWRVAPPSPWVIATYYLSLIIVWSTWDLRLVAARIAFGTAIAAAVWIVGEPWTLAAARGNGLLEVMFLDVGQGDAALVRLPRGRTILIDAGGLPGSAFDIGDRVVAPVLRHAGVRRLDTTAITHAHPDHAGGLSSVLAEFRPREVWDGIPVPRLPARAALLEMADKVRARWTTLQAGDAMEMDGIQFLAHHPPLPDWERQEVRNDDSLVIELRWRDVSFVFAGDVGREVERAMAGRFAPARIRVMTAPHHGSLTSSSQPFLDTLRPRIVVMSAGRGNTFGHPAPEVVERYRRVGADVFRTDRDGAIVIETDGWTVRVAGHTGRATYH